MALTGTLKDFGIAEILQLIAQQAKSGVLHLATGDEEVHVAIADGCVVSAEDAGRTQKDRLGERLLSAALITREQLEHALESQRRTLRRLGDILVEMQFVSKADLKEMTSLQTTETVYGLFGWKNGTYRFEPGAVEWDPSTATPLRAESLLMEGFRRVDEWPLVRRKISSLAMTFQRLAKLNDPERKDEVAALGASERRVFALADPGRPLAKLVDLSRLGEFETSKALLNLVNLQLLRPIAPAKRAAAAGMTAYARSWGERLRRGAAGFSATLALALVLAVLFWLAHERSLALDGGPELSERAPQSFLARYQLERLGRALEVWRLERGEYPRTLVALVDDGLVAPADLSYPYRETYYYRRRPEGGFVLLAPLP